MTRAHPNEDSTALHFRYIIYFYALRTQSLVSRVEAEKKHYNTTHPYAACQRAYKLRHRNLCCWHLSANISVTAIGIPIQWFQPKPLIYSRPSAQVSGCRSLINQDTHPYSPAEEKLHDQGNQAIHDWGVDRRCEGF